MECETAVKEILPALRSLLAAELSKTMTQEDVAKALNLKQPAVSRYLKQSRGVKAQELLKDKGVKEMILNAADGIKNGGKVQFCPLCKCVRKVEKCGD